MRLPKMNVQGRPFQTGDIEDQALKLNVLTPTLLKAEIVIR